LFEASGLMVYYENMLALNNVGLAAEEGSIIGVFGSNSAGKSTLMYMLSGILLDIRKKEEMRGGERITLLNYLTANALRVSGVELPPGPGREDFALICSRCHALPDIRVHPARDWPAVFMRMERNMERMSVSQPTAGQTSRILLYLQGAAQAP